MRYRKSPLQIEKYYSVKRLRSDESTEAYPKHFKIKKTVLADFEETIQGRIVYPWNKGYGDDRKSFNNVYEANPVLIVYAACYGDIRLSLAFAKEYALHTAIRASGHSMADFSVCDGMIIDVSGLNNIYVDLLGKTAIAEAGCTFEKILNQIEFYNLHVPTGGCPTVTVAGFMQGGGYGLTSRTYGMNCDCVLEVTVMLANGRIVVANKKQNVDLFWAVQGGTGGNFGVLLSIKYQLFDLEKIYGIQIKWNITPDPEIAALALYTIQENYLKGNAFPELGIETILTRDTDGIYKVIFCGCWTGSKSAFDKALKPLKKINGTVTEEIIQGKYSYVNSQLLENFPDIPPDKLPSIKSFCRSIYFSRSLTQIEWQNILNYYLTAPNAYTMVDMEGYGGKISSIKTGKNAFIHRKVTMDFFCDVFFDNPGDEKKNEDWLEAFFIFLKQYGNGESYQNYPNRNQKDFREAYWGDYYNQLVKIKKKYDPANFFHYQQSIGKAPGGKRSSGEITLFSATPIKYEKF